MRSWEAAEISTVLRRKASWWDPGKGTSQGQEWANSTSMLRTSQPGHGQVASKKKADYFMQTPTKRKKDSLDSGRSNAGWKAEGKKSPEIRRAISWWWKEWIHQETRKMQSLQWPVAGRAHTEVRASPEDGAGKTPHTELSVKGWEAVNWGTSSGEAAGRGEALEPPQDPGRALTSRFTRMQGLHHGPFPPN